MLPGVLAWRVVVARDVGTCTRASSVEKSTQHLGTAVLDVVLDP